MARGALLTSGAVAALMIGTAAYAQDRPVPPVITDQDATTPQPADEDVIVVGLRESVKKAVDRKRRSKQIVDSVVAEDVGKLPDNNVPEALSRVSGVQIDRARGEGQNVTIRGLSDVQTTINGNEAGTAGTRALNLADIPAELLKSVDVYKTRSADQVEGGIAGTVNVELRRPLDLVKGLTLAGSFRETFSDLGDTKSPYASLLVAERFDTPIGEMGFLVNGSYTKNNYFENYIVSESPQQIGFFTGSGSNSRLPVSQQNTIIPYAINYGVETGSVERPSLNVAYQWRANSRLDFVLEGSYFGVRSTDKRNNIRIQTNSDQGSYSNLVANSDGTIRSVTITNNGNEGVPGGPLAIYQKTKSDTYNTNFETHWNSDKVQINLGAQYNWTDVYQYFDQTQYRLTGGNVINVDFNSPLVPGGGPYVTYPNSDLGNPANYKLYQVHDQRGDNQDTLFAAKFDVTVQASPTGLVRSLQFGSRFSKRTAYRDYGYRDAFYFNTAAAPTLGAVSSATGIGISSVTPQIANAPTWYQLSGAGTYDRFGALRTYIINNGADLTGRDWTLPVPATTDPGESFQEHERTFAFYGQMNYAFTAGFPVDGELGLRYVNTWGNAVSSRYQWRAFLPNGTPDYGQGVIYTPIGSKANYVDLIPSATARLHLTPKLQLRLSYTHNVQRPDFYSMRSAVNILDATTAGRVYSGNPDLKPVQENNYDASLEYYWGQGGLVSVGAFLKNQTGFIYYTEQREAVAGLAPNPNAADGLYIVGKPRNAGPGKIFGIESQLNTFFDFLPGFARHFGVNANFTYIPTASLQLGYADTVADTQGLYDAPFTSKYSGNAALIYETPVFSARLAYNFRSKYKTGIDYVNPGYSVYNRGTSRLDAAINVTPVRYATFSLEATNLLHDNTPSYFGAYNALPVGIRVQARTIQTSVRFRF
ncbi:TonB-dependent receptor [Sphingomonas sp. MA1305]|uniref:TonB-dependent receptor n=1 Tax=Sphingomonas sp. MA1305 TaxID=2479204 RepID=UPI0018DF65A4|nr:TonB-dependent receptor [Sphingomonas sp. MA1305]MBI0475582.1 TonB-dependent receptor [Sphingomonas sp. MA1305]